MPLERAWQNAPKVTKIADPRPLWVAVSYCDGVSGAKFEIEVGSTVGNFRCMHLDS